MGSMVLRCGLGLLLHHAGTRPSVNHLFILPWTGNHAHAVDLHDASSDLHNVTGLAPGESFLYTVVAGRAGHHYSRDELEAIVDAITSEPLASSSRSTLELFDASFRRRGCVGAHCPPPAGADCRVGWRPGPGLAAW